MELNDFIVKPKAKYLATEEGFKNYCKDCAELFGTEEVLSHPFKLRVLCRLEHCVKSLGLQNSI